MQTVGVQLCDILFKEYDLLTIDWRIYGPEISASFYKLHCVSVNECVMSHKCLILGFVPVLQV